METVKVDIQKLQLLNDRINQTIEALTQLRQTVHSYQPAVGLQHSGVPFAQGYGLGYGIPSQQMFSPMGLQHTMPGFAGAQSFPFGYNVAGQQGYPISSISQGYPFAQNYQFGQSFVPQAQWGAFNPMVGGLSHTGLVGRPDLSRLDPTTAWWIAQQFPYAFSQVAPVI